MTTENASMEKCWEYFNKPKPEEKIPGNWVVCIYISKILHLFKKRKKLPRNYFCKTFNSE